MILLFDIGNTHTHVGLADDRRVVKQTNLPTRDWFERRGGETVAKNSSGATRLDGAVLCSVVPRATPLVRKAVRAFWSLNMLELTPKTLVRRGH